MKKFSTSTLGKFLAVAFATGLTLASAEPLTIPDIDTSHYLSIAGTVAVGAGVFYAVRKAIRLLG